MKTIWKYPVSVGSFMLTMPRGAEILDVQMQGAEPVLWALVTPAAGQQERSFVVYGTGDEIAPAALFHRGTFQMGPLVWHLFEVCR